LPRKFCSDFSYICTNQTYFYKSWICWFRWVLLTLWRIAQNSQEILRSKRNRKVLQFTKSPPELSTSFNEFEQIWTRYSTFPTTTEDADDIPRWRYFFLELSYPVSTWQSWITYDRSIMTCFMYSFLHREFLLFWTLNNIYL